MAESEEPKAIRTTTTITVPPELEQGVYANLVAVSTSEYDFALTFAQTPYANAHVANPTVDGVHSVETRAKARIILPIILMPKIIDILTSSFRMYANIHGVEADHLKREEQS